MDILREIGVRARCVWKLKRYGSSTVQGAIDEIASMYSVLSSDGYGTVIINGACYPNTYGDEDCLESDIKARVIEVTSTQTRIMTLTRKFKIKIKTIEHQQLNVHSIGGKRAFFVYPDKIALRTNTHGRNYIYIDRKTGAVT